MNIRGTSLAISIAVVAKYAGWRSKLGPKSCAPMSPWQRCLVMPPPCVHERKDGPPSRCSWPSMTRCRPASVQPSWRLSVSPQVTEARSIAHEPHVIALWRVLRLTTHIPRRAREEMSMISQHTTAQQYRSLAEVQRGIIDRYHDYLIFTHYDPTALPSFADHIAVIPGFL